MEMEYKDPSRRGRYIVIIGVILALVAGGAAFYLISRAQQQAGRPAAAGVRRRRPADDPRAQDHRGDRRRGARGPARSDQRPGHRVDPGPRHRAGPGRDGPAPGRWSPPTCSPRAPRAASSPILGAEESVGPDTPVVARDLDDRARRPGRRRPADPEPDGRRLRDRQHQRPDGPDGRAQRRRLLLRQVDQDQLPEHGDPGQGRQSSTSSGRRSTWPRRSATCRRAARLVQPGPAARRRHPPGRRVRLGTTTNEVIVRYGLPIPVVFPPVEGPSRRRSHAARHPGPSAGGARQLGVGRSLTHPSRPARPRAHPSPRR